MTVRERRPASGAPPRGGAADVLVVVSVVVILYASLAIPGGFDCTHWRARLLRANGPLSIVDVVGNVLAYAVLGAALGLAWARRRAPASPVALAAAGAVATAACAVLSGSMELAQACTTYRWSSAVDLAANTAGAAIGWAGAALGRRAWGDGARLDAGRAAHRRLVAAVLAAVAAWAVAKTMPWLPAADASVVRENLRIAWIALEAGTLDPWRTVGWIGQWAAVGLALALPARRPARAALPFVALAASILAYRLWMRGGAPSPESLAALAVAAPLVLAVPFAGARATGAALAVAAVAAMLAYELQPGHGPIGPFRWEVSLFQGDAATATAGACWFGWFAATLVAAGRALPGPARAWAALPVAVLAAAEWVQTTLPGRTPDLSPPIVALGVAALAAAWLGDARPGRGAAR